MLKLTEQAKKNMIGIIQSDIASGKLDGAYVWQYIENNTNVNEQLKETGNPMAIALSGFFAGIKWTHECSRFDIEDFEEDLEQTP